MAVVRIDGAYGEGGGQILRTSLSLSALLGVPVEIVNIRKNRSPPGLRPQHLTGILALKRLASARVEGAHIGSDRILFVPNVKVGEIPEGKYVFDIGTAGSTVLLGQTILPLMCANPGISVELHGGTHVSHSPSYDYFEEVFLRCLGWMGFEVSSELIRYGFYPKGGGVITIRVGKCTPRFPEEYPKLSRGVFGRFVLSSNLPRHIIDREIKTVEERLEKRGYSLVPEVRVVETLSPGNAITLWYNYEGFRGSYVLGRVGKPAERVAQEGVRELLKYVEYPIDPYLLDQVLLYSLFLPQSSTWSSYEITSHTKSNIYVINTFLPGSIELLDLHTVKVNPKLPLETFRV